MKKLLVFSSVVLFISVGIIFFNGCGKTPEKSLLSSNVGGGNSGGSGVTIGGASFTVSSDGFQLVNGEPPTPTSGENAPSIKSITGNKAIGPGEKQTLTIEWTDPGGARPTIGCFPRRKGDPKSPGSWWRYVGVKDGATSGRTTVEYTFSDVPTDSSQVEIVVLAITPSGGTPIGGIGIHQSVVSVFNGVWKGPYNLTVTGQCTWNHKGDLQVNLSQDDTNVTGSAYMTGVQILKIPGCSLERTTVSNQTITGTASGSTMTGSLSDGSGSSGTISFTAKLSENKKTLSGTLTYTGSEASGSGTFTLTR